MTKWLIPYQGKTWEYDDFHLASSEARIMKRVCGGAAPAELEIARGKLDGDAWIAALAVARRRSGLTTEQALDIDEDDLDLMVAKRATEEALRAELRAVESEVETLEAAATPAEPGDPATA